MVGYDRLCSKTKGGIMTQATEKFEGIKRGMRGVRTALPETMKAWGAFHEKAMASGVIDVKTKELIALGIALVIRCHNCIILHVQACKRLGVTRQEILSVYEVAMVMGGGPAMTYCSELIDALVEYYPEERKEEIKKV